MYRSRRILLSQNFLHSRKLVDVLLRKSSIGKNDLVLDLGAGQGILTEPLAERARQVIGIEIDLQLYRHLQQRFQNIENVALLHEDILRYSLPKTPYKVFANLPFAIEGQMVRKLIGAPNPPEDCYVIVVKKLASRLSGFHQLNQFSALYQPWFRFSILHHFDRKDFFPAPAVEAVLWRFTKRSIPLLPWQDRSSYQSFIRLGYGEGTSVQKNLEKGWPAYVVSESLSRLGISRKSKPGKLSLEQWLRLYAELHK